MKRILQLLLLLTTLFSLATNDADAQQLPAFPGAEGFGMYTTGGRGGAVYHVTTLEDGNTLGTLRYGLETASVRRTIVFDVSGTIHLNSNLKVKYGNVTIAGQTAPGDGICIADFPFTISADNVIIRYLRFRPGNSNVSLEPDGLGALDHNNIIVDHCSISWSVDECCSVLGGKNLTVQWCVIDQSLVNAGHEKGAHGYGGNWGGSGCSYHHNLLAHHTSRAPRLGPRPSTQTDERLDMRNNVIYNWSGLGCYGGEGMNVNIVNNYYKPGPGTNLNNMVAYRIASPGIRTTEYCKITKWNADGTPADGNDWVKMWHKWGTFYVDGNVNPNFPDVTADNWTKGIYEQVSASSVDYLWNDDVRKQIRRSSPIDHPTTTTHTAEDAFERVLAFAGASLKRDSHDTYVVDDARNGSATYGHSVFQGKTTSSSITGFVDNPSEAGGYPVLKEEKRDAAFDSDNDGMPDEWENANGADPDINDASAVCDDGYTYLEHYINSLVADITDNQNTGNIPQPVVDHLTISQSTYTSSTPVTHWIFNNGVTIDNSASKSYATGSNDCIKFSADKQFTVNLPEGVSVEAVTFNGYNNYDTGDSYIKELNGVEYATTDYVFPSTKATVSHKLSFASPVSGKFTFTIGNLQTVLTLTLHLSTTTGIATPMMPVCKANTATYNIIGQRVRPDTKGLVIVNGKKFFIK